MHASSLENMRVCHQRFVEGSWLGAAERATVLDIGGANVNGTYRDIFCGPKFEYIAADVAAAEGVTVVLEDPYKLPFEDASMDVVLSGQALEHCEFFWLAFAEMVRVLKPTGFIFLIAPSGGPIHRFPVDCYRFYPDAYRALAKYAKCRLIDVWLDERGPWNDLVGVFQRSDGPVSEITAAVPKPALPPATSKAEVREFRGTPDEEVLGGDTSYLEILAGIHERLAPSSYLEIGVRLGKSLALARCPAVGIDPQPDIRVDLPPTTQVASMTSDEFFAGPHERLLSAAPDLAFIDGMHLFEFALRDFMHIERIAGAGSLVLLDDVFPNHVAQATRARRTQAWTGDVWKLYLCLREHRPDLFLFPVNSWPAGLVLVSGLDPHNRVLWERYNPIVRANTEEHRDPPEEIVSRVGVHAVDSSTIEQICDTLRVARAQKQAPSLIVEKLRAVVANRTALQR